ncbi:MAG: flippase-like domain-containing protein [Clostridia bacterium]|nr:flippase-like domain-containing protein [Clostridia bacterium]
MKVKKHWPKLKGWQLFNLISLLLIAGLLWGVVVGNQGIGGLLDRWGSLDLRWMIAAVACVVGFWVLEALALHWLVSCLYQGVPFHSNMRTAMIGQLYAALTPFSTGGQPVQLIYMHRDGLDTGGGASVLIVKSILYQIGLILMALLPIVTAYRFFQNQVPAFGWMAGLGFGVNLLVTAGMLLLAVYPRATRRMYAFGVKALHFFRIVRDVDATITKAQTQFDIYYESTLRYEKKRGALLGVLAITFVQLLSLYLVPYAIYRAFGYHEPGTVIRIVSAVAFVTIVSASVPLPGGSGGAEGSFLLIFALFFRQPDLLIAMLLWRLLTYYFGMITGALVMLVSRKRQRAVVRLPL